MKPGETMQELLCKKKLSKMSYMMFLKVEVPI